MKGVCRRLATCAALLGLMSAGPVQAAICLTEQYTHPCSSAETCEAAVDQDALDVNARLSLCQAHVDRDRLTEAAVVLRRGLELCGKRRSACRTLELALSNVSELRQQRERESNPDEIRRKNEALRAYCLGPVSTGRTISACEELIASNDDDAALHQALGRKLLDRGEPARAISAFRSARERGGDSDALAAGLVEAERQRAVLLDECLNDGDLPACDAALLAGAPDEHRIQRQRGRLLAAADLPEQALRAYLTAQSVRGDDGDTARAILDLEPGRFTSDRLELYRARAQAFRVLNDPAGEAAALRDVLDLRPADTGAQRRLASLVDTEPAAPAEEQAPDRSLLAETAPEPDPRAADGGELLAAAEVEPEPPREAPPRVDADEPRTEPAPLARIEPPAQPVIFANAVLPDGRTH